MKFELTLPPTLNHSYGVTNHRGGRSYMYKRSDAKAWQREARLDIYQQLGKVETITDPVKIVMELYLKHNRDIDSSHKLLLDTLEYAQIIKNDKQIIDLHTKKFYGEKRNPKKLTKLVVYVDSTSN